MQQATPVVSVKIHKPIPSVERWTVDQVIDRKSVV